MDFSEVVFVVLSVLSRRSHTSSSTGGRPAASAAIPVRF